MKKLHQKLTFALLASTGVVLVDWWTKQWAKSLDYPTFFGPIKFKLVLNYGVMMGRLSELSLSAKESLLFTLGSFMFSAFLFSIWLIPIRSRATLLGMSLLVGGIFGNLMDRFFGQAVVDFISLSSFEGFPYLNLADLFQFIGYGFIGYGLYRDSLFYWPKNDWRMSFLVNPRFQLRASLLLSSLTFFSCLTVTVFSYFFLKLQHTEFSIKAYLYTAFFLSGFLALITFFVGVFLTHRVAGPVYAIQRNLNGMLKGKIQKLHLRNNDEFKELERTVNLIQEEYHLLQQTLEERPLQKKTESEAA